LLRQPARRRRPTRWSRAKNRGGPVDPTGHRAPALGQGPPADRVRSYRSVRETMTSERFGGAGRTRPESRRGAGAASAPALQRATAPGCGLRPAVVRCSTAGLVDPPASRLQAKVGAEAGGQPSGSTTRTRAVAAWRVDRHGPRRQAGRTATRQAAAVRETPTEASPVIGTRRSGTALGSHPAPAAGRGQIVRRYGSSSAPRIVPAEPKAESRPYHAAARRNPEKQLVQGTVAKRVFYLLKRARSSNQERK